MNKKIISVLAAMLLTASVFAGCGKGNDKPEETTAADTVADTAADTAAESVSKETAETTAAEDMAESDTVIDESSDEVIIDEPVDDEFLIDDEPISEDGVFETVSDNPLFPAVESVLSQTEWPLMAEVADEVILKEFFLLDPANTNYNNLFVMQCPMSATMSEIIVIDAVDVDAAKADLDARKTKAIEVDAWYPNDQILAENSIVGTTGNYAYFLIGESAADAEPLLVSALS